MAPTINVTDEVLRGLDALKVQYKLVSPVSTLPKPIDFWTIPSVEYRGQVYTARLGKSLLPSRTQAQHSEYSRKAKANGELYTGDISLYHAIFTSLSKTTGAESEEARRFIRTQMRARGLMTLTSINYKPRGNDEVVHNIGMDDEYKAKAKIIGLDELIENSQDTGYLEAILGTSNIQEINAVYQWLNGTSAYIWRVNARPKTIDKRVAGFVAYSDRADFYCDRHPDGLYPSLGVSLCEAQTTKNPK